jgi:hypothetical protein
MSYRNREDRSYRDKNIRALRIANGQCTVCGIPYDDGTLTLCRRCAKRASERSKKTYMRKEAPLRVQRIRAGLCSVCTKPRGDSGTKTLCRPCAIDQAARMLKDADIRRSASGFIMLKCENCFEKFEWIGSGQRTMCPPCREWFMAPESENIQEARKVRPWSQDKQLDDWQRQG